MTLVPYGKLLRKLGAENLVTSDGRCFEWENTPSKFELNADDLVELVTSGATCTAVAVGIFRHARFATGHA
jgi:hypothetical protein